MRGGVSSYIAQRSGNGDVTLDAGINWVDLDQKGTRVSTQQIVGINRTITLQASFGNSYGGVYYRVDPSSSSFAANFNPLNVPEGWTEAAAYPAATDIVITNGQWLSFGVPSSIADISNDTLVTVKNATASSTTVDTFNVRTYVVAGGGSSSSTQSSSTTSSTSSMTSSTTSGTSSSSSTGGGGGLGSSNQPPPPEGP